MASSLFQQMHNIDRRWIYFILIISLIVSIIIARPVKPKVLSSVQDMYDTVENAPANPGDGKLILIGMTFAPSTMGENGNQARVLIRHLMLARKRFAIISVGEFQGSILGPMIVNDLAKQYHYQYGVDWINFGFQPNAMGFYTSFPRDIPGIIKTDGINNRPIDSYPIMKGIKTMRDNIALFIDITASSSAFNWVEVVQGRYGLKIGYACTGVMAAEAYPYLDSGQFFGMMPGIKGAADYELLVDGKEEQEYKAGKISQLYTPNKEASIVITPARKLMYTQNIAHLVIILFIIIGNVGLLLSRRTQSRKKELA